MISIFLQTVCIFPTLFFREKRAKNANNTKSSATGL